MKQNFNPGSTISLNINKTISISGDSIPISIDDFRTWQYRVFLASPYFNSDLEYEIIWHKGYLKKLHKHKKNPSSYHRSLTSHTITHERLIHFKEQVIEAIPFHESIMHQHKRRLDIIKKMVHPREYKKLVKISMKTGGTPEYFVYDKLHKKYFFVAEHVDETRKRWIEKAGKICEIIVLDKKI